MWIRCEVGIHLLSEESGGSPQGNFYSGVPFAKYILIDQGQEF